MAVLRPREVGLRGGGNFWLHLTTVIAQCLRLSERFFISAVTLLVGQQKGHLACKKLGVGLLLEVI